MDEGNCRYLWQVLENHRHRDHGPEDVQKAPKGGYPGAKNYVFSRTLPARSSGAVEVISTDAAEFVAEMKRQPGKGICVMGGGELAACLFNAGLIDEVVLNTHPVLLGSGIPLFPALERQIDLELLDVKTLENKCVILWYAVKK